MPLYDFECNSCGARFEAQTPAGAQPPPCEACASGDTRRIFSPFALWKINKTPGQRRKNEAQRRDFKERKREEHRREQGQQRAE
jgi:putative FmdB family regulatory protein